MLSQIVSMKGAAPLARGHRAARRDALRIRNTPIVYENPWLNASIADNNDDDGTITNANIYELY